MQNVKTEQTKAIRVYIYYFFLLLPPLVCCCCAYSNTQFQHHIYTFVLQHQYLHPPLIFVQSWCLIPDSMSQTCYICHYRQLRACKGLRFFHSPSISVTDTDSSIPALERGRTDCLSCMATARTAMIPSVSRRGDDRREIQIFFQYKGWKELQISL